MYPRAGVPTRWLRRALGIQAHASSGFNACVGAALKGKSSAKPPAGQGGFHNMAVRAAFTSAAKGCAGRGA